jgi:hypothetical protein
MGAFKSGSFITNLMQVEYVHAEHIHIHIHTHTYIHTNIHTYIHTHEQIMGKFKSGSFITNLIQVEYFHAEQQHGLFGTMTRFMMRSPACALPEDRSVHVKTIVCGHDHTLALLTNGQVCMFLWTVCMYTRVLCVGMAILWRC